MENINIKKSDLSLLARCAVRYAIGRYTDMPEKVIKVIEPLIPGLGTWSLKGMVADCHRPWNTPATVNDWSDFCHEIEKELTARGKYKGGIKETVATHETE